MSMDAARSRLVVAVAGAAAIVGGASTAAAQTIATEAQQPSPQRHAFEARFGPYTPDVDTSLQGETGCGSGPYSATFGSDARLFTELEFDWQLFRFYVGSFAIGGAAGIFNASGKGFVEGSCARSNDTTDLWMVPLTLLISLRFDYLARELSVPVVPYFKLGLTYAFWWATGPNGISEADDGSEGYGGTAGLRLAGGVMVLLDWLDPRGARIFDNEWGVNNSYIFFEWLWAWVDGFGDQSRMNLSDSTWVAGLALEY